MYRPIVVPAYTRDPTEECLCPKCEEETRLVREGNKFVCPNGCEGVDVLILPPLTLAERLTRVRNNLYDSLPTGELDAFEVIKVVQTHLSVLDSIIDSLVTHESRSKEET